MRLYKVLGYEPTEDGKDREYIHFTNSYPIALEIAKCWHDIWEYSPVFIEETTLEKEMR